MRGFGFLLGRRRLLHMCYVKRLGVEALVILGRDRVEDYFPNEIQVKTIRTRSNTLPEYRFNLAPQITTHSQGA